MSVNRFLYRALNRALAKANLQIQPVTRDFDARLDQPEQIERMFRDFGAIADDWFAHQSLIRIDTTLKAADQLPAFYSAYLGSPFREQGGGSRFNNLAWLYLIARAMRPGVVIDSGTFRGGSAWAFALAVPEAAIYSFDVDLSQLAHKAAGVRYEERDWTAHDWERVDLSNTLAYFDDHLDQARRLIEASARGIGVAIFDDDYPVTSTMGRGGRKDFAFPKIEYVLDDEIRNFREISWINRKGRSSFPIDVAYLDKARARIAATDRLPDTSLVTGIHQTPYRIVRTAPAKIA
jgi:hypothetical protein